jgi:hypothetical protein
MPERLRPISLVRLHHGRISLAGAFDNGPAARLVDEVDIHDRGHFPDAWAARALAATWTGKHGTLRAAGRISVSPRRWDG